jgi:diguanylate cyclase (GGDEF)-like protein
VAYAFAVLGLLLLGAGYLLGVQRGRSREQELRATIDERDQKLTLVEHELLRHTAIDPVTGVNTHQHFQEFLEREWRRASRDRQFVSLIMIEIDHFRAFAERQGKAEGDTCLKSVASVLKPHIHRPGDVLARYGGSGKFGVVLGATDSKGAMLLAERLRAAVEQMKARNPASPTQSLTVTVGVATVMPDREGIWQEIELIAAAERALAQARDAGRNSVALDVPASPVQS